MSLLDLPGNMSSGSVSVSSSVGSHGTLDRLAGSTWVTLVQPPACVVLPPPLAPASGVGGDVTGCLTGAAELGVDVAGPSLPVCPLVATMISLFQSNFAKSLKIGNIGFLSLQHRVRFNHTSDHCYSLVVVHKIPDEPPKLAVACRACCPGVSGSSVVSSGLRKLSRGFSLARRPAPTFSSRLLARYLLDCLSRARLF